MSDGDKKNSIAKSSGNQPPATPSGGSKAITQKDLKAALGLINSYIGEETEKDTKESLLDAADHIRRTGKRCFMIAKAIEDVLDERE